MFPYLQSQRVNLQILQESACHELMQALDRIDGNGKVVVLDKALLGPIDLIAKPSLFSDRKIKLMTLTPNNNYSHDITNIVYVVRPQLKIMNVIAAQVLQNSKFGRLFHIFFVPRLSNLCIKHLEDKRVFANFGRVDELKWNFFPIDADVISMEMTQTFHDVVIDGDTTILYQASLGLLQLQHLYGRIPKIYGKGNQSQHIWELAKQLGTKERSLLHSDKGAIDQLILLDRSIDLLSALATQLTYEGLVDEFFGIHQNQVSLPTDLTASRTEDGQNCSISGNSLLHEVHNTVTEKRRLHSGERLYKELRDKNFNEVGKVLSRSANQISAEINANSQDKSLENMKILVNKLPDLLEQKKTLAMHTAIAELIRKRLDTPEFTEDLVTEQEFMMCENIDKPSSYIEDLIAKKSDLLNVLRFMCIQCAAASGLKEKVLSYYKRELVQVYGIEVLLTINNLEKAGLLHIQSESRAYAVLRKTLNLTVEEVVEVNPKDISYVHSFFAPLTVRIIEQTLKPLGWQLIKSQINNLPGSTFEDFQAQLTGIGGRQSATPSECSALDIPRVILVFFVGGCTFAEIAALRFLSQQEDNNVEFVIATTKIINKSTFLHSVI